MQTVTLSVADEVKAFSDALAALASDIKAGKAVAAILADVVPGLLAGSSGIAAIGADIKLPDNQAYVGYALL